MILLGLCVREVFAETLYLKNGQVIEGTVTERKSHLIKIDTGLGLSVPYYRDEIERIEGPVEEEQKSPVPAPEPPPEVVLRVEKVKGAEGMYLQTFSAAGKIVAQKKIIVEAVGDNARARTLAVEGVVPDGVVCMYDRKGKRLSAEFLYRYNKEEGLARLYYPGGGVKAEMTYAGGRKVGAGRTFYESGAVMADVDFGREGMEDPIIEKGYYEDGRIKYEINRPQEMLNLYDLNGRMLSEDIKERYVKQFLQGRVDVSLY